MSFYTNLGNLRALGRNMVLPAEKIKALLCERFFGKEKKVDKVIDLGAGTLYWSKWFAEKLENPEDVFPVDEIFVDESYCDNMKLYSNVNNIPKSFLTEGGGESLFIFYLRCHSPPFA